MKSFVDALSFPIIGDPSQQDRHADQDDSHMGIPERNGSHTIINKEIKEKKKRNESLLTRAGNRISDAFIEMFSVWDALSLRLLEICLLVSAGNSLEQRDWKICRNWGGWEEKAFQLSSEAFLYLHYMSEKKKKTSKVPLLPISSDSPL